MRLKYRRMLLLLLLTMLFSGCVAKSPDQLYTLPRQPDSYSELQAAIAAAVSGDIVYSAPVSGENRQSVQMQDLDGDGTDEALVFAKGNGELPMKIFVFRKSISGEYSLSSTMESEGTSFDRVSYTQIDGSPGLEIIVGCSISDQLLHSLSVYTFENNMTVKLVSANYTAYTLADLNADGRTDLFVLKARSEPEGFVAELYCYRDGALMREPELELSSCGDLKRMISGYAEPELPAVFVAVQTDDGIMNTDVFTMSGGRFINIAKDTDSTTVTARSYPVYATDIDSDGIMELPDVIALGNDPVHQVIYWYNLGETGKKTVKRLTYHDFSGGFYLILDDVWMSRLQITSESSGSEGTILRFYLMEAVEENLLFALYQSSGPDRKNALASEMRFLIYEQSDICFTAELGSKAEDCGVDRDNLSERFQLIHTDWNTGEM